MRRIDLSEYQRSVPYRLSVAERNALRDALPSLTIEPASDTSSAYHLTPGSTVGAIEIGGLSVLVRPKIEIPQLLSLVCYAMSGFRLRREFFDYPDEYALPDVLALSLSSAAARAFSRGLLHGYRNREEALHGVRGRIMFDEQIRRRFGIAAPVEVSYDEFTDDILANRLVKAATHHLGQLRPRSSQARRALGRTAGILDNVSLVSFPPMDVPGVRLDRLNAHYGEVIALSRLILRHGAYESGRGTVRASGFLMDMNVVFQEFVTTALREALGISDVRSFGERRINSLDDSGRVRLRPDLTWWDGRRCVFVGDVKYKNLTGRPVPNADMYQALAYATALDLRGGLLIYAKDEAEPRTYQVRNSGVRLEVVALDLSGTLDDALNRVRDLSGIVLALRAEGTMAQNAA